MPRGWLATVFAADAPFNAESMLDMLSPPLKKALKAHGDVKNEFLNEMNQQLEMVKKDPSAFKSLKEEMEADIKELNAQVDQDPDMLKLIEQNLAAQAKVAAASMGGLLPLAVAMRPPLAVAPAAQRLDADRRARCSQIRDAQFI
eukprot:TRINITY_DN48660_c0_g1_i1.p1 TRINITY_DN48660_c0_g1~~TRINITY_DN48660_c0_g1_i1.p1  ORF type:complete len:166 (-),score=46.91 TRINITY_DN48660_c0_g1_i1:61-495(-)